MTTPPSPRESNLGFINPKSDNFTGFVFKIQANIDPAHRDRIAFLRISSGKFEKGMMVNHVQKNKMDTMLVENEDKEPILLFESEWSIRAVEERNKDAILRETSL